MKISVKVKTGSPNAQVQKIGENSFLVHIKAQPEKGKANKALVRVLGKYFDVSPSSIHIVSGHTSKNKIVEVL